MRYSKIIDSIAKRETKLRNSVEISHSVIIGIIQKHEEKLITFAKNIAVIYLELNILLFRVVQKF